MTNLAEPKVRIGQIFVSSVSFEHREDALSLPARTDIGSLPIELQIEIRTSPSGDQGFIRMRVETRQEEKPLYRMRVEMIGAFQQEPGAQAPNVIQEYLIRSGAFMMYPFVREFVANLTMRARFGPIWLKPVNFNTLAKEMQEEADRKSAQIAQKA